MSTFPTFLRIFNGFRRAWASPDFRLITTSAILLIITGTLVYSLSQHWSIIDGLYFSVATLTTTNVSDPNLIITGGGIKLFTVFYIVIGIGILLRFIQLIGHSYVLAHTARLKSRQQKRKKNNP